LFAVVEIWSAAVAKRVWRDKTVYREAWRCVLHGGKRQPSAVKCEALPSQLMIKDRHN